MLNICSTYMIPQNECSPVIVLRTPHSFDTHLATHPHVSNSLGLAVVHSPCCADFRNHIHPWSLCKGVRRSRACRLVMRVTTHPHWYFSFRYCTIVLKLALINLNLQTEKYAKLHCSLLVLKQNWEKLTVPGQFTRMALKLQIFDLRRNTGKLGMTLRCFFFFFVYLFIYHSTLN